MNTAAFAILAFGVGCGGFVSYDYATNPQPLARTAMAQLAASVGYSGYGANPVTPPAAAVGQAVVQQQFHAVSRMLGTANQRIIKPGMTVDEARLALDNARHAMQAPMAQFPSPNGQRNPAAFPPFAGAPMR